MKSYALFRSLLPALNVDCVCEIGALDGSESIRFKQLLPHVPVYCFEPNPYNIERMRSSVEAAGVRLIEKAASNSSGKTKFHIADVDYSDPRANRGESSLLPGFTTTKEVIEVETVRIDDFLMEMQSRSRNIALWIDAEGHNYEVVESIYNVRDRVALIHVEVDMISYWKDEKTGDQVIELLKRYDFEPVLVDLQDDPMDDSGSARGEAHRGEPVKNASGNVVAVNRERLGSVNIAWHKATSTLRQTARRALRAAKKRLST